MEALQDVAHISGRPGLFRIIKPGRSGVIVESMDGNKKREIVNVNAKVSVLKDISIYSEEHDKSTPLAEIFTTLKEQNGEKIDFEVKKSTPAEFFTFFEGVMPDFDKERVYTSDIKKIIQWYNLLAKEMPELWEKKTQETEEKPSKKK
ncbi:DUF5606 family protein [Arcticibacterium luteifluviistationis]|uniref:Uncharacterized protein n=1 Tax=Arcticibacterium luteifluviistationis TaxID=1784714 RepID=A0A2Z4GFH4_9BACT|nr:DUF5606 domain-containing protein [Arcticibacterium luteifluviistationis]AWV99911.1 hypothetical protein DJ013_17730 [Arcticibacterium luteifluviistationis]